MKKEETKQPAVVRKELTARILNKVNAFTSAGELQLPGDYSAANALKGAMLILDDMKALEKYDQNSIAQALLKMVVEGLSPIKGQGYFIPFGKELTWLRSYQGSIALAKRVGNVKEVSANVIYDADEFAFEVNPETGRRRIVKHIQALENIDNSKIKGAYAVVVYNDETTDLEVMTMAEIEQAWKQGATKGQSPAHKNFTQEMAKKTVINRACKGPINSSSDAGLFANDEEAPKPDHFAEVAEEIEEQTASEEVEFEEVNDEQTEAAEEKTEKAQPEAEEGTGEAIKANEQFDSQGQGTMDLDNNSGPGY